MDLEQAVQAATKHAVKNYPNPPNQIYSISTIAAVSRTDTTVVVPPFGHYYTTSRALSRA